MVFASFYFARCTNPCTPKSKPSFFTSHMRRINRQNPKSLAAQGIHALASFDGLSHSIPPVILYVNVILLRIFRFEVYIFCYCVHFTFSIQRTRSQKKTRRSKARHLGSFFCFGAFSPQAEQTIRPSGMIVPQQIHLSSMFSPQVFLISPIV